MTEYWDQLLKKILFLRSLYKDKGIPLKDGQGMARALDEAEAVAKGETIAATPENVDVMASVNACHVMWALFESIKACIDVGLNIDSHLRQLTTGTTDYGVPSGNVKEIFFKDFEAELFVAAELAKASLPVQFLDDPDDPKGEMRVEDVLVEVKHPNSIKRLESLMRKFSAEACKDGKYGVFVTAVEDAFELFDRSQFSSDTEFLAWQAEKRGKIESFGRTAVLRAATLPRISALVQTSSVIEVVGDETRFVRHGNSLVYDQRQYPEGILETVESVASVFNPNFRRYSAIRHILEPGGTT